MLLPEPTDISSKTKSLNTRKPPFYSLRKPLYVLCITAILTLTGVQILKYSNITLEANIRVSLFSENTE